MRSATAGTSKRARGLSTDYDDSEGNDDWVTAPKSSKHSVQQASRNPSSSDMAPSRPRRGAGAAVRTSGPSSSVTVARAPSPTASNKKSIRLTVKMPASKLREATSGSSPTSKTDPDSTVAKPKGRFQGGEILHGPRGTRAKRAVVIESGSDDDDEDDEEDADKDDAELDEEDDGAGDEEEDSVEGDVLDEDEEEEEDDEGDEEEDADADGDDDTPMPDAIPVPPTIRISSGSKPTVTVTAAPGGYGGKVKSVEAKEMQMAASATSDDEELSELESDGLGEDRDDDGDDMDEDEDLADGDEADGDVDGDSDDELGGSRGSTPDISKMTKRQRSRLDQVMGNDFLQLPMEPQIKKHLTAEEHAMRRAEMARRRKNLSEKRNEEEKMDTINRLLKKQAPKRRGKVSAADLAAAAAIANGTVEPIVKEELEVVEEVESANPVFTRWVSGTDGIRLGVPQEWIGSGVGMGFGSGWGRPVEEVEG